MLEDLSRIGAEAIEMLPRVDQTDLDILLTWATDFCGALMEAAFKKFQTLLRMHQCIEKLSERTYTLTDEASRLKLLFRGTIFREIGHDEALPELSILETSCNGSHQDVGPFDVGHELYSPPEENVKRILNQEMAILTEIYPLPGDGSMDNASEVDCSVDMYTAVDNAFPSGNGHVIHREYLVPSGNPGSILGSGKDVACLSNNSMEHQDVPPDHTAAAKTSAFASPGYSIENKESSPLVPVMDAILTCQGYHGLDARASDTSVLGKVLRCTIAHTVRFPKAILVSVILAECPSALAMPIDSPEAVVIGRVVEIFMRALPWAIIFTSTLWAIWTFFHPGMTKKGLTQVRMLAFISGVCWVVFEELIGKNDHIKPISVATWYLFFVWQLAEASATLRHWQYHLVLNLMIGIVFAVIGASMLPGNGDGKGGPMQDLVRKAIEVGPCVALVWSWLLARMQTSMESGSSDRRQLQEELGQELDPVSTATSTSAATRRQEDVRPDTGGRFRTSV